MMLGFTARITISASFTARLESLVTFTPNSLFTLSKDGWYKSATVTFSGLTTPAFITPPKIALPMLPAPIKASFFIPFPPYLYNDTITCRYIQASL